MASRTQVVDLDAWFADFSSGAGNGNGSAMSVGMGTSSWAFKQRFAIRIPRGSLFNGIPSASAISSFSVKLRTRNTNSGIGGSVKFHLERGTSTFTEYAVVAGQGGVPAGSNINAFVSTAGPASGEWPGPTRDATDRGSFEGSPSADQWITVPLLALGRWWYANPGVTSLILVGIAFDETLTSQRCTFYTSESSSVPYAEIVYGSNNPPNAPADVAITLGADGKSFTISSTHTDPDGDAAVSYEVRWTPD